MQKISILIPVYNQIHYTHKILQEIETKVSMHHEVILIDDGSTDETRYCSFGDKVKLIRHNENKGVNYSWNEGVKEATGEYVWIINNDILLDEKLDETLVKGLENGIISCPYSTRGMLPRRMPLAANINNICGWCFMLRKKDWQQIPEDLFLWYGDNRLYEHYKGRIAWGGKCHHFGSKSSPKEKIKDIVAKDKLTRDTKYNKLFNS